MRHCLHRRGIGSRCLNGCGPARTGEVPTIHISEPERLRKVLLRSLTLLWGSIFFLELLKLYRIFVLNQRLVFISKEKSLFLIDFWKVIPIFFIFLYWNDFWQQIFLQKSSTKDAVLWFFSSSFKHALSRKVFRPRGHRPKGAACRSTHWLTDLLTELSFQKHDACGTNRTVKAKPCSPC